MQFTQIPPQYAPLGQSARYAVQHDSEADIDIRVLDPTDGSVLAAKRFASVSEAEFDIAPALRRALRFAPAPAKTGFINAPERCVTAQVKAFETDNEATAVTSAARTFLPGTDEPGETPIRTTMPLERLIPEGACDELTLFSESFCTVTVTATSADSVSAENYRSSSRGLQLFRLDTRDFPAAETITVDAGACGTVRYTILPAREGGVRLAWRSSAGSIEHYTFPVVRETALNVDKTRAESIDGAVVVATETVREIRLASAYERPCVLEALAGLIDAREVWLVGEEGYEPVDVATDEATVQRHGSMRCLEITIRSTRKESASWN